MPPTSTSSSFTSFLIKDNDNLNRFFNQDDSHIPIAEFMYVHTHPFITPNFLSEIEAISTEAFMLVITKNLRGKLIDDLERIGVTLGKNICEVNEESSREILLVLRELYILSKNILDAK
jgi:hypothetical protein